MGMDIRAKESGYWTHRMNFIEALEAIKAGRRVTRAAWNKKATVYLVDNKMNNIQHIEVRTTGNCIMYAASSADLLAEDWDYQDVPKPVEQGDIEL